MVGVLPSEGKKITGKSGQPAMVIVIMGVSGSGKSTVGLALSKRLGWPFFDGDDYHSRGNIEKMSKGIPLDDEDRIPWLAMLNDLISANIHAEQSMVLSSSALKRAYRDHLRQGNSSVRFVYLKGDYQILSQRLADRQNHYMKAEMLKSQFEILEEPVEAITLDVEADIDSMIDTIIKAGVS